MATSRPRVQPETVTPAAFSHITLRTSKLPALRDWYRNVIGARVVHETASVAFLTYDNEHHRLALIAAPDAPLPPRLGLGRMHVGYTFRSLRELLGTYVRLRDDGIVPTHAINHGPAISLYYADPDGNYVELQVDIIQTKSEAFAFFECPEFAANPTGAVFDPEDFLAAYESGVSEAVLFTRPTAPLGRPAALALAIARQQYRKQLRYAGAGA